jgi:DNA-binding NarL/FixJ family response regulator
MLMGNPYRIVIVDGHVMIREAIKRILGERPNFEVVGEARDGLGLLALLNSNRPAPHLIILDISMPRPRGIDTIRTIKTMYPDVKVLILTMHKNQEYIDQAFIAGAAGYLLKEDAAAELFNAIERIKGGEIYLSPSFP